MSKIMGISITSSSASLSLFDTVTKLFSKTHVRKFSACEHSKTGASLNKPRRLYRGSRRNTDRRQYRKKHIRKLLAAYIPAKLRDYKNLYDHYELRVAALDRSLFNFEARIVLAHLAKKRGFKSSRKDKKDEAKETGGTEVKKEVVGKDGKPKKPKKMIEGADYLGKAVKASKYRTLGEYLYHQPRRKNHPEHYDFTIHRSLIDEEIDKVFAAQRKFGNEYFSKELQEKYKTAFHWQHPLPSHYDKLGKCPYEPDTIKAPKYSPTAELSVVYQDLNKIRLVDMFYNKTQLTDDQRQQVLDALYKNKSGISFTRIRNLLKIPNDQSFNVITYTASKKLRASKKNGYPTPDEIQKECEKKSFGMLKGWHAIKNAITEADTSYWETIKDDFKLLDEVANVLHFEGEDKGVIESLHDFGIPLTVVMELVKVVHLSDTSGLSLKAHYKLLPLLKRGVAYATATKEVYPPVDRQFQDLLPVFDKTNNPVVDRAAAELRKMLNAFIRDNGMPDEILIRMDRDLPHNKKLRDKISKENTNRRKEKDDLYQEATNFFGRRPTGEDFEKYQLWLEQDKKSIYTGKTISEGFLKDPMKTEIDFILPISRSHNRTWDNKILAESGDNRFRNDKTFYEAFHDTKDWDVIVKMAKTLSVEKARRILIANFDERVYRDWQQRHINDSRYAVRHIKEHIEKHLDVKVDTRKVAALSEIKWAWKIETNRSDIDYAMDAMLTAASDKKLVHDIACYNKYNNAKEPDLKRSVHIRTQIHNASTTALITHTPKRKMRGPAHKDTLMGIEKALGDKQGCGIKRIPLTQLNAKNIDSMVLATKNPSDPAYKLIRKRLEDHKGDGKKAFKDNPIVVPSKKGPGLPVHTVKVYTNDKTGLYLKDGRGFYANANILRVDIYKKDDRYYGSAIYGYQFAGKGGLPDTLEIKGKTLEANDYYCSIYPDEYIETMDYKGVVQRGYLKGGIDIETQQIRLECPYGSLIKQLIKGKNGNPDTYKYKKSQIRTGIKQAKYIKIFEETYSGEKFQRKSFTRDI